MSGFERALWVTAEPPDFAGGGGNRRQAHLLDALAARLPVHLVVAGEVLDPAVRDRCERITEVPSRPGVLPSGAVARRLAVLGRTAWSRTPTEVQLLRPVARELRRFVQQLVRPDDLVVVQHGMLGTVAPPAAGRTGTWVIELHHLLAGMYRQQEELATGRRQRWLHRREARRAAAFERALVADYDASIVCSGDDAIAVGASSIVAPNGVDVREYPCSRVPDAPIVLFPGTMSYLPNVEGATWLVEQVWPAVREAVPAATLEIVGRAPVEAVRRLAARDVTIHADVASMGPYFERARVVVVPLRIGTGTRLKALEAMATGRPLVGTTIGLEGLGVDDGVHALVEDRPERFAAAIRSLLLDDALAARLGAAGRELAEARFDWRAVGERYAADLLALAGTAART